MKAYAYHLRTPVKDGEFIRRVDSAILKFLEFMPTPLTDYEIRKYLSEVLDDWTITLEGQKVVTNMLEEAGIPCEQLSYARR